MFDLDRLQTPTRTALDRLATRAESGDFYLAGSAALALHLAHRRVRDLDFMSATNRLAGPQRRDLLAALREADPATAIETARDGFLYARLAGCVGARFYHYPYPLIEPLAQQPGEGVAVASLVDLGLMKIAAIISRAARRDALDLATICRKIPLAALLARAPEKFGHVGDFQLQALKALADRSDYENEPLPDDVDSEDWRRTEHWLAVETARLGREHSGLAP
jgi:hypothetical protein